MCTNADKDALNELHETKEDGGQTIVLQFSPYMVRNRHGMQARALFSLQLQERSQPIQPPHNPPSLATHPSPSQPASTTLHPARTCALSRSSCSCTRVLVRSPLTEPAL